MQKQIPVIEHCSLSAYRDDHLLADRFAHYLRHNGNLVFPHRHNFYHAVLFTKGRGHFSIDFNKFSIEPWMIYFMAPGQVHTWQFEGDMDGYVVNFSRDFFQSFLLRPDYMNGFSFFDGNAADNVLVLPEDDREAIRDTFERLVTIANSSLPLNNDLARTMILYIFMLIDQRVLPKQRQRIPGYNYTILRNFQALIEKHYTGLRLPKDYAELLFITSNHLNALCKEYLGMQAGEVIRNRVLLEAKRLLVTNDHSITEIGYLLNFNDNSYFTKFFKKLVGVTPDEFRKRNACGSFPIPAAP